MEEEHINPASEEPKKSPGFNKLLFPLFAVLILAVGAGAFLLGSQRSQAPSPSPTATVESVQTEVPSPSGSPTATPKPTKTPSPSPTPSPVPTPTVQTKTITSTASLDGWRASNGGRNTTWYIQAGHNNTLTERGYVSFDLSSLPGGANIDQATLRLYQGAVVGTPYASNSLLVDHMFYGSSLDSITYDTAPLELNIGTLTSNAAVEWKDLVVTNSVINDISNGRTQAQFRLRFSTETTGPDAWARFESGDNHMGTGNLPQLVVKYY